MKIAYIINHLGETGVNNVVLDLVTLFASHGHICTIFYFEDVKRPIAFPCPTIKIEKTLPFEEYDIIHTHGIRPNVFVLKNKPWNKTDTKFIATLHCYVFQDFMDLYGKIKGFFYSFLFLLSVLRHDTLITLSKDALHYYRHFFPWKKISYVYNTRTMDDNADLNHNEKNELMSFKKNNILIGMNGVLIHRKGIDLILRALEMLPHEYRIIFVGGNADSIEKWKKKIKPELQNRVYFAGSRPMAYRYLPYYDIYALPSRSEGFPLAMVEAAAKGCKIVSSELPQLKEIFIDNEVQWCKIGNAESLANAIKKAKLLDGNKAQETFKKKLSPEIFYQRHFDIYNAWKIK